MAQHTTPHESNYPAQLLIDNAESCSAITGQPIPVRRPIPIELGNCNARVFTQPVGTQATRPATTSTTHQATGNALTAANIAKKNGRFDSGMNAVQSAARAQALQKAGKDLGFDLPVQNYMDDQQDLAGWLAQQSK